jgi:AspT/YidE/YbjL antiporter-like protein
MLNYAESFGLIIFVYALGLQVGPGFFGSFRKGGMTLNMLAFAVILVGTAMTLGLHVVTGVSLPDMVGILSGAVTNTPALGAAQQTLKQMHIDAADPALGCAANRNWPSMPITISGSNATKPGTAIHIPSEFRR